MKATTKPKVQHMISILKSSISLLGEILFFHSIRMKILKVHKRFCKTSKHLAKHIMI